jgi:hypothetical protein
MPSQWQSLSQDSPPNEAKTHSKYALTVTGASTLWGFVVAEMTAPPGTAC